MTEKQPGIGFDEIVRLAEARRRAGFPSAIEIEAFLHTLPEIKLIYRNTLTINEDVMLRASSRHRSKISIPKFCAILLINLVQDDFLRKAEKHLSEGRTGLFMGYHDLGIGTGLIFGRILSAEGELSNPEEKEKFIPEIFPYQDRAYGFSSAQDEEARLSARNFAKEALGILLEDKTGMLLVDNMLDKIRSGSLFKEGAVTKEYAIAGAELGADLYKQLYRMIEQHRSK